MNDFIDAEIDRRSERGRRLAVQYENLPKGLDFEQFLAHPDIDDLDLDFITASEMFDTYKKATA